MVLVYYGKADVIAEGTNADIDTLEADIVTEADLNDLSFSQLSMYVDVDLGTHTAVDLRVYGRGQVDGDWHELIKRDISSGLLESNSFRFNSSSPTKAVIDLPISATFALKVTGQGIGGANASVTVRLLGRKN